MDRHLIESLRGDDPVVPVVVDLVVADSHDVAVVVGFEAVTRVAVHLVSPPVFLLVAVRAESKVVVVYVQSVDVTKHVDIFENIVVTLVDAKPPDLVRTFMSSIPGRPQVSKGGYIFER